MDYDKLIGAVKLCGSTPKVYQCKQCAYWAGGDMSKCIPKMTAAAATAIETLRADLARVTAERDAAVEWIQQFTEKTSILFFFSVSTHTVFIHFL